LISARLLTSQKFGFGPTSTAIAFSRFAKGFHAEDDRLSRNDASSASAFSAAACAEAAAAASGAGAAAGAWGAGFQSRSGLASSGGLSASSGFDDGALNALSSRPKMPTAPRAFSSVL
jgi:hypothetical protein